MAGFHSVMGHAEAMNSFTEEFTERSVTDDEATLAMYCLESNCIMEKGKRHVPQITQALV